MYYNIRLYNKRGTRRFIINAFYSYDDETVCRGDNVLKLIPKTKSSGKRLTRASQVRRDRNIMCRRPRYATLVFEILITRGGLQRRA